MSKFQIKIEETKNEISPPEKENAPKQTPRGKHGVYLSINRTERKEIYKKLIKLFRAACNGKNYYKKWFPELKDTGDFEAAFISELNKLVK